MSKILVCKICECEEVETKEWVQINSGKDMGKIDSHDIEDNWCPECEEHCELKEVDDRTCHLCGTHTVDKWCDNEDCAEYIRDERITNENKTI